MQRKRLITVIGAVGVFATVMALTVLLGVNEHSPNPVYAQDGETAEKTEVSVPWGTVTATSIENPVDALPAAIGNGSSGTSGASGTRSAQSSTPVTTDQISRSLGYVRMSWTNDNDPPPVSYRVERRLAGLTDPEAGWRVIASASPTASLRDSDVAANLTYQYRITPILEDGSELTSGIVSHFARQRVYLYGVGNEDGVLLTVRKAPHHPRNHQSVTITRYTNVERTNGIPLVSNHIFKGEYAQIEDSSAAVGSVYYYKMEVFYRLGANAPWVAAPFAILPVAIKAGVSDPIQPTSVQAILDDNTVKVTWTVVNDDKQALLYEVQRRKVKPINDDDLVPIGTTTKKSFAYDPDDPLVSYEYKVVPFDVAGERATTVSNPMTFPTLSVPLCYNPYKGLESDDVSNLYLFRDITAEGSDRLHRTWDTFATDEDGYPCIGLNTDDFYLERWTYYKDTDSSMCPRPPRSCVMTVSELDIPDGGISPESLWLPEIVYGAKSLVWGVWKWRAMAFVDNTVDTGAYKFKYRVCAVGYSDLCSRWEASGLTFVGITSDTTRPFDTLTAPPPTKENRVYGAGIITAF